MRIKFLISGQEEVFQERENCLFVPRMEDLVYIEHDTYKIIRIVHFMEEQYCTITIEKV